MIGRSRLLPLSVLPVCSGALFAIPRHQPQTQYSIVDFGKDACHSILTNCRVDTDCCSGLSCKTFDGESLCIPGG
ncbi:hypothetical protein VTI74DRAFT_5213 [Chaetomium olivicolor]